MSGVATKIAVLLLICTNSYSQTDSLQLRDIGETEYQRKVVAEWVIGNTFVFLNGSANVYDENGEISTAQGASGTRNYFTFGVSGQIPLAVLGRITTLWLVPGLHLMINTSGGYADKDEFSGEQGHLDVALPVHVCYGIGGLYRRQARWGFDAGLGVTLAGRGMENVITIQPSALIQVSYTPGVLYRLRITADVLPATFSGPAGEYRRFGITVAFILAI